MMIDGVGGGSVENDDVGENHNGGSSGRAAAVGSAGAGSAVRMASVKEAAGTTYYVSNSGNDAWDGLSPARRGGDKGTWQTIGKINRSILEPGDLVLLERGGTWRDQLTVPIQ